MSINQRSIFGKPNPIDNGLPPASAADGGDDSLSARDAYTAPLGVGVSDQGSAATEAERGGLESAFRESQRANAEFVGSGAEGSAIGRRGEDTFTTTGATSGDDFGTVVSADPAALITRATGADKGDGTGKAIG